MMTMSMPSLQSGAKRIEKREAKRSVVKRGGGGEGKLSETKKSRGVETEEQNDETELAGSTQKTAGSYNGTDIPGTHFVSFHFVSPHLTACLTALRAVTVGDVV